MKQVILFTVVVSAIILTAGIYLTTMGTEAPVLNAEVTQADHIKGNRDAPLTLIEYSDFQCSACAGYAPTLQQLLEEFPEDLRLVYRHFPLTNIHKNAEIAARATEATAKQGKFFEMHDLLFQNQASWAEEKNAKELFTTYAEQLELNSQQFANDIDSKEVKDKIFADRQSGMGARVNSTPSFYLNGTKLQNPNTYEQFKSMIQSALEGTKNE